LYHEALVSPRQRLREAGYPCGVGVSVYLASGVFVGAGTVLVFVGAGRKGVFVRVGCKGVFVGAGAVLVLVGAGW
jgi:hypothetical protein